MSPDRQGADEVKNPLSRVINLAIFEKKVFIILPQGFLPQGFLPQGFLPH